MGRIVQTHGSVGSQAYEIGFVTGAVLLIVAALTGLRWLHPERSNSALNGSRARGHRPDSSLLDKIA